MVGPHPRGHLSRPGSHQSPARTAVRAEHAALAVLDDLVSDGVLADQYGDCRRCLADRPDAPAQGAHDLDQSRPGAAMTDRSPAAAKPWPPLVVATSVPTWIRVRDFALTLLMWVLFGIMLETEFELFFAHYLNRLGLGDFKSDANWLEFFRDLLPFLLIALGLVLALIVAALFSLRRAAISRRMAQPKTLTIAEERARVGLDETELLAARETRVVVVQI